MKIERGKTVQSGHEEIDNSSSTANTTEAKEQILFSVGIKKLIVLNTLFLGLYAIFWMYKNWQYMKNTKKDKCIPIVWAIFSPITFFALIPKIKTVIHENGGTPPAMANFLLGLIFFACNIASRVDHPACTFLFLLNVIPLVVLQKAINATNGGESVVPNTKFSKLNIVFSVILALLWVMGIAGSFIKD